MSTETTARLDLPLLAPGQAQKELFHNEALAALDVAVQASVRAVAVDAAPDAPGVGDCWVVGETPTGEWADHPGAIAGRTAGGWRFIGPREGLAVWDEASRAVKRYVAGGWREEVLTGKAVVVAGQQVVGARQPPIAVPQGGSVIDAEARATLAILLTAVRSHGLIGT
jgi:hypothetical protein